MTAGGSTTYTSDAKVTLLASNNSGAYFVAKQTKTLGTRGQRSVRTYWTNLGQHRDRSYGFQVSDPTPTFSVQVTADLHGGKW